MTKNIAIIKRLYKDYTIKFIKKILIAIFLSILVAGSTALIAYLLDPAIKKIFIEKDQTLLFVIPIIIIFAFATKGISLYLSKAIMIGVAEEVKTNVQKDMMKALILADTKLIETKHTGKFISNLTNDVGMLTGLISTAVLNIFKDSLTLVGLLTVMFLQNWKLSLIAIILIPIASTAARTLGKRMGKVTNEQMHKTGILNTYLMEIFKNHKLIKIFQTEEYENNRAKKYIDELKKGAHLIITGGEPLIQQENLTLFLKFIKKFYLI